MDPNVNQEEWQSMRELVQRRWHKLTDEDLAYIQGNAELAAVRIRERYDIPQEEAAREWAQFREQHAAARGGLAAGEGEANA